VAALYGGVGGDPGLRARGLVGNPRGRGQHVHERRVRHRGEVLQPQGAPERALHRALEHEHQDERPSRRVDSPRADGRRPTLRAQRYDRPDLASVQHHGIARLRQDEVLDDVGVHRAERRHRRGRRHTPPHDREPPGRSR
ncbi:unnamed protein product, partial [Ectocarpus fasciculatus]